MPTLTYAQLSDLPDCIAALIYRRWYNQPIRVAGPFIDWLEKEIKRDETYYHESMDAGHTREAFTLLAEKERGAERKW